jgi:histidinol-phosphate aminotransferase
MPFEIKSPDYIYKIEPYIPGKPVEEVEREKGLKNIVKLASNENPLGPSPLAVKAIRNHLKNLNRYPDGSGFYLKKDLSEYFKNYKLKAENFILGNGSNELIDIAVRTFCNKDENIIAPFPSFVAYYLAAEQLGLKLKISNLSKDYKLDLNSMLKFIDDKTKIIFVSNPNNPTGTYYKSKEILKFIKNVRKDILVIVDEAYIEYIDESILDLISFEEYGNVLILRTFSKAYGLAGLRIGYGIACKELLSLMDRVREPFNVNSLSLAAGQAALKDEDFIKKVISVNDAEKKYLYGEFQLLNIDYVETGANFILVDLKDKKAVDVNEKLLNKGVIVRPMNRFGYENMIRITIGKHNENLKLIRALKSIII